MGTNSLTYVICDEKPVVCMYRHYDGYLKVHGQEICEFLKSDQLIGSAETKNCFIGEIAAKLICFFKNKYPNGDVHLDACDSIQEEEFVYIISYNHIIVKNCGKEIFKGTFAEFYIRCHPEKEKIQDDIELIEKQKAELESQIMALQVKLYQ